MTKITAGKFKNKNIKIPNSARPFTQRVRKTLFDILNNYEFKSFLDIFSGAGSIGIEAISRGVMDVTFVDKDSQSTDFISKNLSDLKLDESILVEVKKTHYRSFIKKDKRKFDVIVADPPFDTTENVNFDDFRKIMHNESILIIRVPTNKKESIKKLIIFLKLIDQRIIGTSTLLFLKKMVKL